MVFPVVHCLWVFMRSDLHIRMAASRQSHGFGRSWNELEIHNASELSNVYSKYINLVYFVFFSSCFGETSERWDVKSHFISFQFILYTCIYDYQRDEGITLMPHLGSSLFLNKLYDSVILPSISAFLQINTFQIQNAPLPISV